MHRTLLACLVFLAACSNQQAPDETNAPAEDTVLTSQSETPVTSDGCDGVSETGYCGVTFGMAPDEAISAFPGGLVATEPAEGSSCYYLNRAPEDYDFGFMVENGSVQRIDVRSEGIVTAAGAGVGTSVTELQSLYPDAETQPNKYVDLDDYIVSFGNGNKAVFQLAEDGETVGNYHVGQPPVVFYVEGCL